MLKNSFYDELSETNKYIIKCCFFIFFVNGLYAMVFGSILPLLSEAYQLNDTVSGMLISSHQAGNLIAGFLAGILPVYLGRKNSILFLSSFVVIGFLLIMVTGQPWLLLVAFFFTGISRGSISNFNNKTVNDVSNSSPAALNFLHSLFAVGALLSPFLVIITTKLFGFNGWRITSAIIIVLILISQYMFSKMPISSEDRVQDKKKEKGSYAFFSDKHFWTTVVILFFYLCAEAAITGWLVKYFVDTNIMTVAQAQLLSSVLWLAILVGRLACTFYGSRFAKSQLLLAISIGTSIFYILLLQATNFYVIMLIIFGLGASMGGIYPTAMTIAGSSIKKYPMAMGWLLILGGIGGITMPIITGVLSTNFGILAGMSAIIVAIIVMLIGVISYVVLDKKVKKN
ncbi:MFS transporter [Vagococcus sp. PNs007]|uniref:MFS transporter n=1 Tax=Vagococcus proximus TaxID=2991417 RepID=A0ABT5X2E8_9ENTE|nr:MFS transporter [Vagococcus proximus]MDF0480102.1 MFS transporter [Vagococcus proximus]